MHIVDVHDQGPAVGNASQRLLECCECPRSQLSLFGVQVTTTRRPLDGFDAFEDWKEPAQVFIGDSGTEFGDNGQLYYMRLKWSF